MKYLVGGKKFTLMLVSLLVLTSLTCSQAQGIIKLPSVDGQGVLPPENNYDWQGFVSYYAALTGNSTDEPKKTTNVTELYEPPQPKNDSKTLQIGQMMKVSDNGPTYLIAIKNTGDETINSIDLSVSLPDSLTYLDSNKKVDFFFGNEIYWENIGDLGPGDIMVVSLKATADQDLCEELSDSVEVTGYSGGKEVSRKKSFDELFCR